MNQINAVASSPHPLQSGPVRVGINEEPSAVVRGHLVCFARLIFTVLMNPVVRDAWRSASGDVFRAIEPTKRAVRAVMAAVRVTVAAWVELRQ
jgi:hypothetical protein